MGFAIASQQLEELSFLGKTNDNIFFFFFFFARKTKAAVLLKIQNVQFRY